MSTERVFEDIPQLGWIITEIRDKKSLSQEALGKILGASQTQVSLMERNSTDWVQHWNIFWNILSLMVELRLLPQSGMPTRSRTNADTVNEPDVTQVAETTGEKRAKEQVRVKSAFVGPIRGTLKRNTEIPDEDVAEKRSAIPRGRTTPNKRGSKRRNSKDGS